MTRGWLTPAALSGALFAALVALAAFAALVALAATLNTGWAAGLDVAAATWFDAHRSAAELGEADGVFGYIGRPVHVLIAALVSGLLLSVRARSALPALLVTGAVGAGVVVEQTFKAVVGRTPEVLARLQETTAAPVLYYQHSFPSGHVTGTAALLGMIAACLASGRGPAARAALAAAALTGVLAVAVLALYTRAHTLTDVVGGMVLGAALVSGGTAILRATAPS